MGDAPTPPAASWAMADAIAAMVAAMPAMMIGGMTIRSRPAVLTRRITSMTRKTSPNSPSTAFTTTLRTSATRWSGSSAGHHQVAGPPFHRAVDVTAIAVRPTSIQPVSRMR